MGQPKFRTFLFERIAREAAILRFFTPRNREAESVGGGAPFLPTDTLTEKERIRTNLCPHSGNLSRPNRR